MTTALAFITGALIVLVAVCAAEPAYRDIVRSEVAKEIIDKIPDMVSVTVEDRTGDDVYTYSIPVDYLKEVREYVERDSSSDGHHSSLHLGSFKRGIRDVFVGE